MKILIVSYYPLPYVGGLWTVVSNLRNELTRTGHEVDILAQNESLTEYRILGQKAPFQVSDVEPFIEEEMQVTFPKLEPFTSIYLTEVLKYTLELTGLALDLSKYDIIHAQDVIAAAAIDRIKPAHIPIVTSIHGYLSKEIALSIQGRHPDITTEELYESFEYQYNLHLEHIGCHVSELIHTPATITKVNLIEQHSIPEARFDHFPYGIDIEAFRNSPQQLELIPAKKKPVILFAGRIVQVKGVHILVEALRQLKTISTDWECWILGTGDGVKAIKNQIKNADLTENIKLFGSVPNVKGFLDTADIFVSPSLQDTQPYSVIEAQLSGLPVVVSDAGGLPEMVQEGLTGLLTETANPESLAQQLARLLQDAPFRQQLGNQAKQWAEQQWSLINMGNNTFSLYKKALGLPD
ncbi:Glycosyltransferase involved in cell wall bisynthesis [Terribacillus aidingensis]|uniref:Glycosyltransferase involved in cell wall bisynthesis n=1 Tax=Terribacillus aidingensis TaxID=586416 RepID=A0A285N289_9BACI|nr:glycosyltransferase family 4 protein [Terribacillus aidingensis]SNZ03584.1 Glycosyltransferase involved in cell wall bisynthesis [Terribacillus aidingensis]